ncbi:thermosome subunit [Candidatus Woesearchaeota archaeon]|nr:thermosome subunit [Candidatus Woesearchaeota archaeon]
MSDNIQPVFILNGDSSRTKGREAQKNNIEAAKLVAEMVRTTLGPKGMDKMIVDALGDVTVTNDGVTILDEMNIAHPTAKMVVEIAKTQETEVGDGTTTAVVLAGELLKRAESLLEQEIHPTIVAKGYRLAAEKARSILEALAESVKPEDKVVLQKVAATATTGKGAETAKEHIASLVVEAVLAVAQQTANGYSVDRDTIKIEKKTGDSVDRTTLIKGLVLDKERVHPSMPTRVEQAKILLLNTALEIRNTETDAKITITDPAKLQEFLDMEEQMLQGMADKVVASGANVVLCQKGIDDVAQHHLSKANIFALRRVKKSDLEHLAKATGARIVSNIDDCDKAALGSAGLVEEAKVGDDALVYIKECKHPKALTILVRGGTEHVIAEIKRAVEDAIGVVAAALTSGKVVAGAGAPELELARQLRTYASSLSGREQLAVQAFADAMEVIPRTLAENAGIDPIDALTELKAAHGKKEQWAGINVETGRKMDAWKAGVLEPLKIKTQAVSSAAEVAVMILRIDDVINAEQSKPPEMPKEL